jgi:WD40 repeat protein
MVDGSSFSSSTSSNYSQPPPMLVITTPDHMSSCCSSSQDVPSSALLQVGQHQQQLFSLLPDTLELDIPSAVNSIAFASVPSYHSGCSMEDGAKVTNSTTTWIACGCRDGSILFWNSQTGRSHNGTSSSSPTPSSITLKRHTRGVPQLIFSSPLPPPPPPPPLSSSLTSSVSKSPTPPFPLLLASASLDGTIRLWKVPPIPATTLVDARNPLVMTTTTTTAAAAARSSSRTIGEGLTGRRPAAYTIAFSPNGQELACAYLSANHRVDSRTGQHSNISIWSTRRVFSSSSSSTTEDASSSSTSSSGSEEDDTEVDTGEEEEEQQQQCLHRWGAGEGSKLFVSMAYYNNYHATSTNKEEDDSGRYLASCRENETTVTVWDLKGGSMIKGTDESSSSTPPPSVCAVLTGHSRSICHMVSSPATTAAHQQRYLATASNDGTVRLWNIPQGTCAQVLGQVDESGGFASPVRPRRVFNSESGGGGGMEPNGRPTTRMTAAAPLLQSQEDEDKGPVQGASTTVVQQRLQQRPRAVAAASASYNPRRMGRGGSGPTSGEASSNTTTSSSNNRNSHALRSIVFGPTGLTLASARLDGTICVWRVNDGTCLAKWSCHFENIFLSLGFLFCNDNNNNDNNSSSPLFHKNDIMVDDGGGVVGTTEQEGTTEQQNGSSTTITTSSIVASGSSGGNFRFDRVHHHQ